MHILQPSPTSAILPVGGVDAGLHHFIGVSWDILIPYTIVGAALMVYSHVRLIQGQKVMLTPNEARSAKKPKPRLKASLNKWTKSVLVISRPYSDKIFALGNKR